MHLHPPLSHATQPVVQSQGFREGMLSVFRGIAWFPIASLLIQFSSQGASTSGGGIEAGSDGGKKRNTAHVPPQKTWLHKVLPAKAIPYAELMRLDKPIGTFFSRKTALTLLSSACLIALAVFVLPNLSWPPPCDLTTVRLLVRV